MPHKRHAVGETVYFHFAANDTSGSGADGDTPTADVRLCGAAAAAAPVLSPTPVLLSHASYPDGCYEVAIAATAGNGFASGAEYAVFCSLAVDSQNPTGLVGSFTLATAGNAPDDVIAWIREVLEADVSIDTEQTPWQLVAKVKGTDTERLRKDLTQADGANVTAATHLVANQTEP